MNCVPDWRRTGVAPPITKITKFHRKSSAMFGVKMSRLGKGRWLSNGNRRRKYSFGTVLWDRGSKGHPGRSHSGSTFHQFYMTACSGTCPCELPAVNKVQSPTVDPVRSDDCEDRHSSEIWRFYLVQCQI